MSRAKENQRFTLHLSACNVSLSILGPDAAGFSKAGKDRAVRPCVAATPFSQIKKRAPHGFERCRFSGKILCMTKG